MPRSVVSVVLLLGLAVAAFAHLAGLGPVATPVRSATAGAASCELIVNGGFESPALTPNTAQSIPPAGWFGLGVLVNGRSSFYGPFDGNQFVSGIVTSLSQAIPTVGLGGETLTASFSLRTYGQASTVTLGGTTQSFSSSGAYGRFSLSYLLPDPAPATTTISFDRADFDLDAVSVVAESCDNSASPVISGLATSLTTNEDTPVAASFTVDDDDTPPASLTLTATGPGGARVTFGGSDSDRTLTYTPTLNANGPDSFTVVVSDGTRTDSQDVVVTVTPVNDLPVFDNDPADIGPIEAPGPGGAIVTFPLPGATDPDGVDGDLFTVTCDPAGGSLFALGETTVTCTASDGESSDTVEFTVTVTFVDVTDPVLMLPASITAEATSSTGATVPFTVSATDLVDGSIPVVCRIGPMVVTSPAAFAKGTTTVTCTATDAAGNDVSASFTVTVRDTTGPGIRWVGGLQPGETYTTANLPAAPTCEGIDTASPVTQCRVYGYQTIAGRYTLTARARDAEGNSSIATRTYTVVAAALPTATPVPPRPTATPTRPGRPTTTPVIQPTSTPVPPTAIPTNPANPTIAPTRPPRG